MENKDIEIRIRQIEEKDFESLVTLFHVFAEFEKMPGQVTNTVDRMMKEKEHVRGFVAKTKTGEIIGYVTWFYAYFTWSGKAMYMDDLYVKAENRGHGIGKKLMNAVIEKARSTGCHKLHWQVSSWNQAAIAFYRSLGATIDAVESNCDLLFE